MKLVPIEDFIPLLKRLSTDEKIPKYATNLVYLTSSGTHRKIEKTAIDSILSKTLKRADIYWFVHVNVLDEPYALRYHVDTIVKNDVYFIEFNLGFLVMDSFLSFENDMPFWKNFVMKSYYNLRNLSVKESENFGLDPSNVTIEKYPVVVTPVEHSPLLREQ